MYCSKCGFNNIGDVKFCQNCGASVADSTMYSKGQTTNTGTVAVLLKRMATSPLFLVAVIAYTVSLLAQLLYTVSGVTAITSYIYRMASLLGVNYYILEELIPAINVLTGASTLFTVIGMVPEVLIAVGLWLTFASGYNRQTYGLKTTGLTIIKVILMISLVYTCVLLFVLEILMIVMLIAARDMPGGRGIFVGVMIVAAVCFAVGIVYYVFAVRTVNTVRQSAVTGEANSNVSRYVAVICFISGCVSAVSAIVSIRSGVFQLLHNLGAATASISFGIFLFTYRGKMLAIRSGVVPQQNQYVQANVRREAPTAPWAGQNQAAYAEVPVQQPQVGETTVLRAPVPEAGGTTVLSQPAPTVVPSLTRLRTGEVTYVNQPVFRLGKDPEQNNYCIGGNSAISRHHCDIVWREDGFYIIDQNSSNHVYVNGSMLSSGMVYKIESGAVIRLADEDFLFQIN